MLSALIGVSRNAVGLPAGLPMGPMLAGIVFGVNGLRLEVPRWPYLRAQALIGSVGHDAAQRKQSDVSDINIPSESGRPPRRPLVYCGCRPRWSLLLEQ